VQPHKLNIIVLMVAGERVQF